MHRFYYNDYHLQVRFHFHISKQLPYYTTGHILEALNKNKNIISTF